MVPWLALSMCAIALAGCTLTTDLDGLEGGGTGGGGSAEAPIDSVWSRSFGGTGREGPGAVAVGPDGTVTIAGALGSQIDLGGGLVAPYGDVDAFVLTLDEAGVHVWSRIFGGVSGDAATDVVVDPLGNVVVTGMYAGQIDFGDGDLLMGTENFPNLFVAKLDPTGGVAWARGVSGFTLPTSPRVSLDGDGNVVLTAGLRGNVDFGGGALTSTGTSDVLLVKLDGRDGAHVWSRAFGSLYSAAFSEEPTSVMVEVDDNDTIFLTGPYRGSIDISGQRLSAPTEDTQRIFVASLDATASSLLWVKEFGAGEVIVTSAALTEGAFVLAGNFGGTLTIDGGTYGNSTLTSFDLYVARFDTMGLAASATTYPATKLIPGDLRFTAPWSMDVDSEGAVLLAGQLFDRLVLGPTTLESIGEERFDIFVAKLAADGTPLLAARYGDDSNDIAMGSAFDAAGNIVITGSFESQLQLGDQRHTSQGGQDIFVAKLAGEP